MASGLTPCALTTREVSDFLRSLDRAGLTARNVNKHRQVLATMFGYACRVDTHELPSNPVDRTDKRPEPPPALDYYEVEEAEALARAAELGHHRSTERDAFQRGEDEQDAELYRVLFYTTCANSSRRPDATSPPRERLLSGPEINRRPALTRAAKND